MRVRVCVVGAGIAGLSTAFHLAGRSGVDVEVWEQRECFGGRAGVDTHGEHCPRFFMADYHELFAILRRMNGRGGRSVYDDLRVVHRFAHTSAGWVEISHLYRLLAGEIPVRERLSAVRRRRPSPLLGERRREANGNRYGRLRDFSPWSAVRAVPYVLRSKGAYVLPGSTDDYLITPWVRHLRYRGVAMHTGRRVLAVRPTGSAVRLRSKFGWETFDVVVIATYLPDTAHLLDTSWLGHRLVDAEQLHCAAFTIDLDPAERVLAHGPGFYCRDGLNVLVQPNHARAVVLCTRAPSTDPAYVVASVRDSLGLTHPLGTVRTTANSRPGESLFAARPVRATRILRMPAPGIHFAGSYLRNSYSVDAAESAARSAVAAVRDIVRDHGLPEDIYCRALGPAHESRAP